VTSTEQFPDYAGSAPASAIWNGSTWVPVVDPRPAIVVDTRSDASMLLRVVGAVLVLGLVLAGLGHLALTRFNVLGDPGVTVIGTVDLEDLSSTANGCQGIGTYSDVTVGTPVTLTDGSGAVLGTAELGDPLAFGDAGCLFTFRVAHVPTSADGYTVTVGDRESVASSRDAMIASGWTTELHLTR
jgi:hypothetical protein